MERSAARQRTFFILLRNLTSTVNMYKITDSGFDCDAGHSEQMTAPPEICSAAGQRDRAVG